MIEWSNDRAEICGALAEVSGKLEDPEKGRKAKVKGKQSGVEFEYRFASLGDALPAIRATLSESGCALVQGVDMSEKGLGLITEIVHRSGQWVRTYTPMKYPDDPQALGSAITYARRYGLWSILGIASVDEDDDGAEAKNAPNEAQVKARKEAEERAKREAEVKKDAERRAAHDRDWENGGRQRFFARANELGFKDYDEIVGFTEYIGRPRPSAMTEESRMKMLDFLGTEAGAERFAQFMDSKYPKEA